MYNSHIIHTSCIQKQYLTMYYKNLPLQLLQYSNQTVELIKGTMLSQKQIQI